LTIWRGGGGGTNGWGEGQPKNFLILTIFNLMLQKLRKVQMPDLTFNHQSSIIVNMNNNFISSAYDSLTHAEREVVDSYVQAVRIYAERNNELIIHSLSKTIPDDVIARSRGILEKPLVKAAIYEKIQELSDEQDVSPKRVLREHMNLATSNMSDYLKFGDNGFFTIDLSKCTRQQMAAVKRVKVENGIFGTMVTIDLHNKEAHLNALTKMMGLDQADNPVYLAHTAAPKDVKSLNVDTPTEQVERSYVELLEAIK
jgi:hypothetical protein